MCIRGFPGRKILRNVQIILINYCNYVKSPIILNGKIISGNKHALIAAVFISPIIKDFWKYQILEYPGIRKLILTVDVALLWLYYLRVTNTFHLIVIAGFVI